MPSARRIAPPMDMFIARSVVAVSWIRVPERARCFKTLDRDQHLLNLRPMPVQGNRIAARGPGVAETDHAADIFQPKRGLDDGEREDHILAGVGRAMFLQDAVGG